ncbi:cytochrome P450 1A1 isoform X1 [Patella vulgata]|uniref:cytochrome P450 1A1 isoform X1 n=2 Tax=Patella vulgata TaxID=6465 RepID=UPI0021805FA5|nr:cytochrome P450 1A1 isoform X1 [Patella vulgata]
MFSSVLLLIAVLSILVYWIITFLSTPSSEEHLVSILPGKLPFIGHAWKMDMSKPHIILAKWAQMFGSIYRIQLYNNEILVLNDYKSIYEALVVNGTAVSGRPPMYRTSQDGRNRHSIVWQTYNDKLMFLRKEVLKSLKMYGQGLEQLESKCMEEIQELLKQCKLVENNPVDPWQIIYESVCSIMLNLVLGSAKSHNSNSTLNKIKDMNVMFNDTFGSGNSRKMDFLPWMRNVWCSEQQRLKKALILRDEIWNNDIKPLMRSSSDSVIHRLLMFSEHHSTNDLNVSEDTAKEVFTNLILAGTDTTSTALTCLLLLFLHYPDVQERMYEEISSVVDIDRPPRLTDRSALPYCEAVLLELLRYISHVPLSVPHYTMQETTINGKRVPADLTVYINLWALHHDENIWEDPWTFNPDRFIDENGRLLGPGHQKRRRLMVFGAGRRVCLGETLAKNRLFLFATSLVQKLTFSVIDRETLPSCDPRTFEMGLVLHPKPFQLILNSRNIHM